MAFDESLAARIRDALSRKKGVEERKIFGCICFLLNCKALADVRRFPGSRKHPHFSRDRLATALPEAGAEYRWFEALGGRRGKASGSAKNLGLRNESFRNYADYMATPEFQAAVAQLVEL